MMPPSITKMMSNGASTSSTNAISISANIPAAPQSAGVWSQSFPGAIIMEPILEEEEIHSPLRHTTSPASTSRTTEQVRRKREVYTSEQVDTLVSTLPKDLVPGEWRNLPAEEIVSDPVMAQTYVTQLPGQTTNARSTRKTYVYESHVDDPDSALLDNTATYSDYPDDSLERHSHSTQKVTRVTKITTTRSIKQVPIDPSDIFFDADGNPTSNGYDGTGVDYDSDSVGIDLSHSCVTEHEELHGTTPLKDQQLDQQPSTSAFPSAPSKPEAVLTENNDILLSWQVPDKSGTAGEILGYLVEFRRKDTDFWEPAHDELLVDNECRVSKLDDSNYSFRVAAANSAGFGPPSLSSQIPHFGQQDSIHGKPRVLSVVDGGVLLEWKPFSALNNTSGARLSGYLIEYRTSQNTNWLPANDFPINATRFEVVNLRPGDYDFRVLARYEDGRLSNPSEFVRVESTPTTSGRFGPDSYTHQKLPQQYNPDITRPGKPQIISSDTSWVRLRWTPSTSLDRKPLAYLVEVRETSDPSWFVVGPEPIASNEFIADNLHPESSYEFRVSAMAIDGTQSMPSATSDPICLNALQQNHYAELNNLNGISKHGQVPERPSPCEYLDFDGGNSVTLCWLPAKSVLPVLGYQVEFRDIMQDSKSWYEVTENLVRSCKTTVGFLINGHQYQFRVIAKNANGFSEPSDPSPLITIGSLLKEIKYLEAERHAAVSLLQDEILRESPPLPERDDSPPPMNRQPNLSNLQYRDPTLREVIDYLKSNDENIVIDASGYLQHLTYNNDLIKEDTRQYGGIPLLIRLLQHRNSEVVRNSCGSLKNLAFGRANDINKRAINADGGVKALAQVIKTTANVHVREEGTGALCNISACDDLKEHVFHQVADVIVQFVVVPASGMLRSLPPDQAKHGTAVVFRNGTGILGNVSAASPETRKLLRVAPNLIEALLFFLRSSIQRKQVDNRAVENVCCILRNLSYRVQEIVDPKFDPRTTTPRSARERSKSAPSFSPKNKKKSSGLFKKNKKEESPVANGGKVIGPSLLWHRDTVELYLQVLQESADPEILEASAAAIQNLAACQFDGSVQVRSDVRTLKGLPILVELLKLRDDKVVCSVVTALRNLCIDPKNLDLIGRHAMRDLVIKLPAPDQQARDPHISDATIGAVLGIFWEVARSSLELTRLLHDHGSTDRLRSLAKSYPMYGKRVCKYATQVLYLMWQHKELQDTFKRVGLTGEVFYAGTIGRKGRNAMPSVDTTTLRRPISSMGRPAQLRSETANESMDSVRYGQYDSPSTGRASSARLAEFSPVTPNSERSTSAHPVTSPRNQQPQKEPVYASVQKHNGNNRRSSVGGDSWV